MKQAVLSRPWLWEVLLIGVLTVGALALRLYRLTDIPPGFHGDEAAFGLEAQKIARGDLLGIWTPVTLGHATGHLYWTAFLFKLGGASVFTVRLAMALLGTFTVPVAYLLFRQLFSRRVALVATALIVFSFWHLIYSRSGWTIVPAVFVLLASLACLFYGWRKDRWLFSVLGGILLGVGFYTHKNFPFYYMGVWVFLLPHLIFGRSPGQRQTLGLYLLYSVLAAVPFFIFAIFHQEVFTDRFRVESFFDQPAFVEAGGLAEKAKVVGDRIKEVFLYVHNAVPRDYVDGVGGRPLLDRVTESFFWLGLLVTILRLRHPAYQLIAVGLLAGSVPPMLVVTGEQRRLLAAMPFVMLCVALGLDAGLRIAARLLNRLKPLAASVLAHTRVQGAVAALGLAGFLAFFSFTSVTYYFNNWASDYEVKSVYVYDLVKAIKYLKTLDRDAYVYFYSDRWSFDYESRQFLLPEMRGEDRSTQFGGDATLERRHEGPVVYLLMGGYLELAGRLRSLYPEGDLSSMYHEAKDSDGRMIFAALAVW